MKKQLGHPPSLDKEELRQVVYDRLRLTVASYVGFKSRLPFDDLKKIVAFIRLFDELVSSLDQLLATCRTFRGVHKSKQEWTTLDDETWNNAWRTSMSAKEVK